MSRPRPDLVNLLRRGLRPLAVLFVVGHLVTLALTLAHTLHVDHVRCVEHGEMVHAHDEGTTSGDAAAADTSERESAASDTPAPIESHGHCVAFAVRDGDKDTVAIAAPAAVAALGFPAADAARIARQAPHGTVMSTGPPLLARAPKTSPPRA